MRLAAGAAALVLLAAGAGRVALRSYVEQHRRAAEQAAGRYDFDEAERQLADCLRLRPGSAELHLQMARAARRGRHPESAAEHLAACRRLEGDNPDNALEAILLRVQGGDVGPSERLLQQQVDNGSPDAALILEAMALGYIQVYRLDAAMFCLNKLLERDPDNVIALLARASLWKAAGNKPGAAKDYRHAVEAWPQHREARLRLGEFLLFWKLPDEALPQFEYLRQLPGGDAPEVLLGLARCYERSGQTEEARRVLDELLSRRPDDADALLERGKVAQVGESRVQAEAWLRRAVAAAPSDAQANFLLAQVLEKQGKHDEARRYEAAHRRIEDDLKELESAFRRVMKNPRDPEPRLEAGKICLRNGKPDEAERWMLSALEQSPNHGPTRSALADFYERTGKPELAGEYRRPPGDAPPRR